MIQSGVLILVRSFLSRPHRELTELFTVVATADQLLCSCPVRCVPSSRVPVLLGVAEGALFLLTDRTLFTSDAECLLGGVLRRKCCLRRCVPAAFAGISCFLRPSAGALP